MPTLQQLLLMPRDQRSNSVELFAAKAVATLQPNRFEPKLGFCVVPFYVTMRWFTTVAA
jgi:hypothetical protein